MLNFRQRWTRTTLLILLSQPQILCTPYVEGQGTSVTSPPQVLTAGLSKHLQSFTHSFPSPCHISVMFSFAPDSVSCTGPGQLYKGAFWCLCFPFAQTDVRITLPSMTRGGHENAMCYLQASSVIPDRQELCLAVVDGDSFAAV